MRLKMEKQTSALSMQHQNKRSGGWQGTMKHSGKAETTNLLT
jgi:hypothetical protein